MGPKAFWRLVSSVEQQDTLLWAYLDSCLLFYAVVLPFWGLICPDLCAVSGRTRKDGSSFADLGTSTLPLAMPLCCCREASGDGGTQVILWKSLEQGLAHESLVKVAVLFPLSCAMVYLLWEPGGGLKLFMKFLSLNQPGALIKPVLWRRCSWVLSILSEFCVAIWDVLPLT